MSDRQSDRVTDWVCDRPGSREASASKNVGILSNEGRVVMQYNTIVAVLRYFLFLFEIIQIIYSILVHFAQKNKKKLNCLSLSDVKQCTYN